MKKSPAQTHSTTRLSGTAVTDKKELLTSDFETRITFLGINKEIENTRKATIQERRRAKYLPKALDIITGSLPSDDEIATKNSESAWDEFNKRKAISNHLVSTALGPMSGNPVRIIEVIGDSNPDAVEININTHEVISPDIAKEISHIVKQIDDAV